MAALGWRLWCWCILLAFGLLGAPGSARRASCDLLGYDARYPGNEESWRACTCEFHCAWCSAGKRHFCFDGQHEHQCHGVLITGKEACSNNWRMYLLAVLLPVLAIFLLVVVGCYICRKRRRSRREGATVKEAFEQSATGGGLPGAAEEDGLEMKMPDPSVHRTLSV